MALLTLLAKITPTIIFLKNKLYQFLADMKSQSDPKSKKAKQIKQFEEHVSKKVIGERKNRLNLIYRSMLKKCNNNNNNNNWQLKTSSNDIY